MKTNLFHFTRLLGHTVYILSILGQKIHLHLHCTFVVIADSTTPSAEVAVYGRPAHRLHKCVLQQLNCFKQPPLGRIWSSISMLYNNLPLKLRKKTFKKLWNKKKSGKRGREKGGNVWKIRKKSEFLIFSQQKNVILFFPPTYNI